MNTIVGFFTSLSGITERLGVCGNVGLIAGALAGVLLTVLDAMHAGLTLGNRDAVYVSLILAAFTWLASAFALSSLVRLTFASIALPSLINCLLTCLLVVFVCAWLGAFAFAWLIGLFVGALVGQLLCRITYLIRPTKGV